MKNNSPLTDPQKGLTSAEVEASRKAHGSNVLTPPERDPWWVQLAENGRPLLYSQRQSAKKHKHLVNIISAAQIFH